MRTLSEQDEFSGTLTRVVESFTESAPLSERAGYTAPWLAQYPAGVPVDVAEPTKPAFGLLLETAKKFPTQVAFRYYKQSLTYAEVADQARRVASMLIRNGVRPGDRVGLLLPNIPEYATALNGIWMAGGIAVALSPLSVPQEVSAILQATNCRIVIALDLLAPLILNGSFQPRHIFFTTIRDRIPGWLRLGYAFARMQRLGFWPPADGPNQHDFMDEVRDTRPLVQPVVPASLSDAAYILPTGGTTGAPKAVTLSHRNLMANAAQCVAWSGGDDEVGKHTMLSVLPYFHSFGLIANLMTGTAMAATQVLLHRFIPRVVTRLIEEHQPTIFNAVPAMLASLNELFRTHPLRTQSLRFVQVGGAPLDVKLAEEFARHTGAQVVEGYGLSEASPCVTTGPLDGSARSGSIGLPLPGTELRIVDAETGERELPAGEVGELIVRGPQVMLGYWNNPTTTAQTIRDGWLFTGDMASRDADGFFRIVDRKKDLIITSGFNVYPCDVEAVLRQFAGIDDVAVIGTPDPICGELVKAMIVRKPGARFDRSAFDQFCHVNLAAHKRPKVVEVMSGDLPRNFLGKVQRRKLRGSNAATAPHIALQFEGKPATQEANPSVATRKEAVPRCS